MKKLKSIGKLLTALLVLMFVWGLVRQTSAEESAALAHATQPLAEGVPEIAVTRLRALLNGALSNPERQDALLKLAEALVATDAADEALKVLDDPAVRDLPSTKFPRAQAFCSAQRWTEAEAAYAAVAADAESPHRADAIFGRAEALRALGRGDEALQNLTGLYRDPHWSVRARLRAIELLLDKHDERAAARLVGLVQARTVSDRKERRFLRGRLEARQNHLEKALEIFTSIVRKPEGATQPVLIATLLASADAHLQLKTPELGDDALEDFIEHHPTDSGLGLIFAKLDEVYATERKPSRIELARWRADAAQPRRAFAQWYGARMDWRAGLRESAAAMLAEMRASHPALPALAEALLEFGQLQFDGGRADEALAILADAEALHPPPALAERIEFLAGRAEYDSRRFEAAAERFENAARTGSGAAQASWFNASVASLQLRNNARFLVDARELGASDDGRAELMLDDGLMKAAQGDPKAEEALQNFLRDFAGNKRTSEAWVALAELAFHAAPPRVEEARKDLAHAREKGQTEAAAERGDYLALWMEDTGANSDAKTIRLANEFLQKHPGSSFLPEVRMKLAEASYRQQDFASAQTQFELLARQNPSAPTAEQALFFAGESAMQSMGAESLDRALKLFDEVVKRAGDLRWPARNEEAVVERRLRRPEEALTLYEEVLKGDAKPADKREALCGKGDILFEKGATDQENYRRAIAVYDQLGSPSEVPPHWRNQALFKKGVCLEKLKNQAGALETFYSLLEDEARPDRRREFFWFYKAGFNAARLLEEEAKWEPAAAIYEKLASASGPRSDEAKTRLARLRLEHFLWQE